MIPVKLTAALNAGRRGSMIPVFCRKCGKQIKQTKGGPCLREVCGGCMKK